jgi:DNA invertase Pin-like site-specific DNA recombinase
MARIGYARVSTVDQDLDAQLDRLQAEGCGVIRAEKVSGASRDGRTELETIIQFLRPGDELVVTRLDRLGRDTRDVLNIVHECDQLIAQMERRFIKERQREGIERALCAPEGTGSRRAPHYAPAGRLD